MSDTKRSNVSAIQHDIDLLEQSMEQRLTDGELYIIVQIFYTGGDTTIFDVDINKNGKSLGIEKYYVRGEGVYSTGEWNASAKATD